MYPAIPDFNRSFRRTLPCHIPLRIPPRPAPSAPEPVAPEPEYVPAPGDHRLGVKLGSRGRVIALSATERRAHTHILGGTGRGKSYFLQHLIRQDFDDPDCGLCLLDPHGSLYRPLVRYIAEERPELAERVVLFDPSGANSHIPGFNPIGPYAFEYPEYTLNMLVDACLKAWRQDRSDRTPRITRQLENIFAPIIVNGLTLIETVPLISTSRHSEKRRLLLAALDHELIRAEWEEFEAATATVRQQLLEGAGNRLRKFLSSQVIRQVLGQQEHVLDIDRIVAEKKILLVNLAPGMNLSRENANLLGILMINELFRAAMLRNPDTNPHPFFLYIDEFAQLITPTVANILDECRKYGLFLTLAHQHLAQLKKEDEWLFASILANCHNRFVFGGLNVEDAELLARQVYTGFEDLKQVKHTDWQTKFRPVEEERVIHSRNRTKGSSRTEQFTKAFGTSTAHSHSLADAIGTAQSRALARSETSGIQQSRSASLTLSDQQGGQRSDTVSREQGATRTSNWSDGKSEQEMSGQSDGETHQEGTQRGQQETAVTGRSSDPYDRLVQRQRSATEAATEAATASDGTSRGRQTSHTAGKSHQEGGGASLTASHGKAHSDGSSWGRGTARSATRQDGISRSTGETATDTASQTHTHTLTDATSETASETDSYGEGYSESESEGEAETRVPFLSPKEFQEAHLTFWTAQEIELMRTGQMKEQPVGVATVKIGPAAPVQVKIDTIAEVPYRGEATERAVADLHDRVAQAFPEFYATPEEVQQEVDGRQMKIFGEVLRLELKPARLGVTINGEAVANPEPRPAVALPATTAAPVSARRAGGRFSDDDDAA